MYVHEYKIPQNCNALTYTKDEGSSPVCLDHIHPSVLCQSCTMLESESWGATYEYPLLVSFSQESHRRVLLVASAVAALWQRKHSYVHT